MFIAMEPKTVSRKPNMNINKEWQNNQKRCKHTLMFISKTLSRNQNYCKHKLN